MTNNEIKIKEVNKIEYINKIELTVILKENPKIRELKQKAMVSSVTIEVINAQASWNGLNFTTLSIYETKLKKEFLKLKERDIVFVKGKIHNRYYPNKTNHKTFFSIEVLWFQKIGKQRKKL